MSSTSDGYLSFELRDPWQKSTFVEQIDIAPNQLFELKPLEPIEPASTLITTIPDLEHEDSAGLVPREISKELETVLGNRDEPGNRDFWDQDFEQLETATSLLTWEAYHGSDQSQQLYLSETSQEVFDAVAHRLSPSAGVLPQDAALRSLCSLALGRSSLFYRWNTQKDCFEQTVDNAAVSGYTTTCSDGVAAHALMQGTLLRRIQDYVSARSTTESAVLTTFLRSVKCMVDVVEGWTAAAVSDVRSLLQFEHMVSKSLEVLQLCWRLCREVDIGKPDHVVISALSSMLQTLDENGDELTRVVAALLRKTIQPWTADLLDNIGLGTTRGSRTKDHTISNSHLLSDRDEALLNSIMKERDILQKHEPDHPLLNVASHMTSVQDLAQLDQLDDIVSRASRLERELEQAVLKYKSGGGQSVRQQQSLQTSSTHEHWAAFVPDFALDTEASTALDDAETELEACLRDVLAGKRSSEHGKLHHRAYQHAAVIRPLLVMQSRLTHYAVMSLLFNTHHLSDLFDLHRRIYLFGSADFLKRLSSALFEAGDEQLVSTVSRHRRRMGLGLNTVADLAWPPSSSDLSLNLIGVLDEVDGHIEHTSFKLSFAVKELSEAEIERVCDPSSIYALDFIRLHCNTASPLDDIFTPSIAQWYDDIFARLLLHTRMVHMVTTARARLLKSRSDKLKPQARYVNTAYYLVTTIAINAVQAAVTPPWEELQAVIEGSETTQDATKSALDHLRESHVRCLDHIRKHLFIGRRYEEVRNAQNSVYTWILGQRRAMLDETVENDWGAASQNLGLASKQLERSLETTKHHLDSATDGDSEAEAVAVDLLLRSLRH